MKPSCLKCGSRSVWYEREFDDIFLHCLCGKRQFVMSLRKPANIEFEHIEDVIRLPKMGTNLWATLMTLLVLQQASSAVITQRLVDLGRTFTVSDVSSYLTILRSKGLVLTTEFRRGIIGGSTWVVSGDAHHLIGDW